MKQWVLALLGSSALLSPAMAWADEAIGNGDIIVTAERREGSLQRTPIAVTALSESALQDIQITRTADLQRVTPSLSVAQGTVDPTTLTIFMRGAGQNAGTWVGYESAVGLYVDDLYFSRLTGANVDLADLERIEVLRGPQGTLYGRNTLVGGIKYVTKKPNDTTYGSLLAEYGSYDMVRVKGTVSTPVSEDWAVQVSGNYFSRDGMFNAPALNDDSYGDRTEYGGRVAVRYIGSGPFEVYGWGFYSRAKNDGSIGLATDPVTLKPASKNRFDYLSPIDGLGGSEVYGGSLTLGYELSPSVQIKSITGVVSGTQDILADTSAGRPTNTPTGPYDLGFDRLESDSEQTQFSQEFQINGEAFDSRLNYILGLYYFRETGSQRRQDFLLSQYNTLQQDVAMKTTSYAAFAQLTYKLSQDLSVIGGLRYTDETKSVDGVTQNGLAGTTFAPIKAKQSASSWTPKFGLNWQVTPDLFGYASISRGFQAGGYNYLAVVNPEAYMRGFKPQTVWAYEVGVKASFLDRRARLNIAAFRNDFDDIQTNVVINGSALTQNAGTARVEGVEAELSLTPVPALTLFGNMSYNHDKYLDLDPASSAAAANAQHLPNVPHWQWGAGFSSQVPTSAGDVVFGGDVAYRGDQYLSGNNAPITMMEANTIANAYIGFKPAGLNLDLRASVANLFGEKYYVYGNVLGSYGLRSPGDPRTFKISAQYRF